MNKNSMKVLVLSIGLALSAGAMAQGVSKSDQQAAKANIAAAYKSDKAACGTLTGNSKDICEAEASGKEKNKLAELAANYTPSAKTRNQVRVVKAESNYAVAKERCDDFAGNAKDVCLKEAKSAEIAAKADAKVHLTTSDVNAAVNEKNSDNRKSANLKTAEARRDAVEDKTEAQYAVEKQKCEAFAGDAKAQCLSSAKTAFGK